MKHVFIVNPKSGKADASQYFVPALIERIAPLKLDYAVEITAHPGPTPPKLQSNTQAREPVRFYALRRRRHPQRGADGGVPLSGGGGRLCAAGIGQ